MKLVIAEKHRLRWHWLPCLEPEQEKMATWRERLFIGSPFRTADAAALFSYHRPNP